MKNYLLALSILVFIGVYNYADPTSDTNVNRVRKYLADNGQSNASINVDFALIDMQGDCGVCIWRWNYTNIAIPRLADCPSAEESNAWAALKRQNDKPPLLKQLENLYVIYLTNDWTMCLHTNNIIPTNQVINVTNTSYIQNMLYLITLRAMNREQYIRSASEFKLFEETFRDVFNSDIADVTWHDN